MDAPEDRDIKLYRTSADLLEQLSHELPKVLWKSSSGVTRKTIRIWASERQTNKAVLLLEPFQEWPQLLDPHLGSFCQSLVDAFVAYLVEHAQTYTTKGHGIPPHGIPLPRAVCQILYTLCKVRGVNVIVLFFKNDPQILQPMLEAFVKWDSFRPTADHANLQPMTWQERYVMFLWLSHLVLTPFNLDSVASEDVAMPSGVVNFQKVSTATLPPIAISLLKTSMKYVKVPGKERDAATTVLVRLSLRPDMQKLGLLKSLVEWAISITQSTSDGGALDTYEQLGALAFLNGGLKSAQLRDMAPFLAIVFKAVHSAAIDTSNRHASMNASASARRFAIKILRSSLVLAMTSEESSSSLFDSDQLTYMLEESIEYFLGALADNDTPVRFAASKALSIITLELDTSMAHSVVEAVIDSLRENLLFEDPGSGQVIITGDLGHKALQTLRTNISGVDPLRWQGLMLTLAHLLYRRSPPLRMLSEILICLVSGLEFEQRSSTGASVGTGVRDAACFGFWAIARKYSTAEMRSLDSETGSERASGALSSTMQVLANALIVSGCTDPSGNIRRGASAALQELIGRHPDTVHEGISVVQVVDYHAVARRSRAVIDVSVHAASLHFVYGDAILEALRGWRGIGSPDADSRRNAATAIGRVSLVRGYLGLETSMTHLMNDVSKMTSKSLETQHGLLLSLASMIESYIELMERTLDSFATDENIRNGSTSLLNYMSALLRMSEYIVLDNLKISRMRPHLTAEGCSELLLSLSKAYDLCMTKRFHGADRLSKEWQENSDYMTLVLSACVAREEPEVVNASSQAASAFLATVPHPNRTNLMTRWLGVGRKAITPEVHAHGLHVTQGAIGPLAAYGAAFHLISVSDQATLHHLLCLAAMPENTVETREAALRSLASGILPLMDLEDTCVERVIRAGLNDYTTDSRGDVGSLIRMEAIRCTHMLMQKSSLKARTQASALLPEVSRLAAEKVDKIRFQAWSCLRTQAAISEMGIHERERELFDPAESKHMSDVSSLAYFRCVVVLLDDRDVGKSTLQGLATSCSAGSESIIRASRHALIDHLANTRIRDLSAHIFADLLHLLEHQHKEDRWLIPALELLGFLLAERAFPLSCDFRACFDLTQKAHYRTKSIPKLEAAIKVYSGLLESLAVSEEGHAGLEQDVLKKLTSMLLHSYPKVRNAVVDQLFLYLAKRPSNPIAKLTQQDWWAPPRELKPIVDSLRRDLLLVAAS